MDRLHAYRIFAAVAAEGGFAPAARQLGISPSAVTRAVAALEASLGLPLFHRTTRHVRLSEAGARFLLDVRQILDDVAEAEAAVVGAAGAPRGPLRITAPLTFGRMHVAPVLFAFNRRYPDVEPRLTLSDRIVDLVGEGLHVAVRIGHLPDSGLVAARIGSVRRVVCAAPDYLERHGTPRSAADLAAHAAVGLSGRALHRWDLDRHHPPRIAVEVDDVAVAVEAARAGLGLVRLLDYQARPALDDGALVEVLADHAPPPLPVHLVFVGGRRAPAPVRCFVDFATDALRARLGG